MVQQANFPLVSDIGATSLNAQITPVNGIVIPEGVEGFTVDLTQLSLRGQLGTQRSIYIDNTNNDAVVIAECQATGQTVLCPKYSTGWFPLLLPEPVRVRFYIAATDLNEVTINANFCNIILQQGPTRVIDSAARMRSIAFNAMSGVPLVLVPAIVGQLTRVYGLSLALNVAGSVQFNDNAGALTGTYTLAAGAPLVMPLNNDRPYFQTGVGLGLTIILPGAANAAGVMQYVQS